MNPSNVFPPHSSCACFDFICIFGLIVSYILFCHLFFWIHNIPGGFLFKPIQICAEFPRVVSHWTHPSVPLLSPLLPENVSGVPPLVSNRARFRRGFLSPGLNRTCPLPNLPVVCALNFLWLMMSSNVSFKWQIDHNAKDKLATSLPC